MAAAAAPAETSEFGRKKKKKAPGPSTFKDRYELTDNVLGSGVWSVVKECRDKRHGVPFAAKIISKKSPRFDRSQMMGEIAILQKCKGQDTIIQFIEFFEDDESLTLIFEKLDGGPLMDHIQRCKAFTEREASMIVKDIATALAFLHSRGIAHRDIKPDNILCLFKDRVYPVKLCDFNLGAARSVQSEELKLSTPVGTPEFMSPELAEALTTHNLQPYDELCDVWSLGVILHIMLTGTAPFSGDCGRDCGWNRGLPCEYCAEDLLENIARGSIDFSGEMWKPVSGGAKDLIARMLVRAPERLSARQVLSHPWICKMPPDTPLPTPTRLKSAAAPLDSFLSEAIEKARIVDTKVDIAAPSNALHRRRSSRQLVPSFASVQGHDLNEIRTPRFHIPSPLVPSGSLTSLSPHSAQSDSGSP